MTQVLPSGTILDERYQLKHVLGQGGFGITYQAVNIRLDLKVAIKELFWKDHCERNEETGQVKIIREEYRDAFEQQKENFLREARIIRDFSSEPGVVHVLDYFEENATAYIVMEYIEGDSLEHVIQTEGAMEPEVLFRTLLPIVNSLEILHENGIIHRDISPSNIILQKNGKARLVDFGTAKQYTADENAPITRITKECYSPVEMLDVNGKLGPWTDVYSFCATLYYCLTTTLPESSMQRMFVDDLNPPSQLGIELDSVYESVIMKGLSMDSRKRYQKMEDLADDMRSALPADVTPQKSRKGLIAIIAAAAVVIAALLITLLISNRSEEKFKGIETESFQLKAPQTMSVSEFADAQKELKNRLNRFAGNNNYIMDVKGNTIRIVVPYEAFAGESTAEVIKDNFLYIIDDKNFTYSHELKGTWEDPEISLMPGTNQVGYAQFGEPTAVLLYSKNSLEELSKGQLSNLMVDVKVRLDALKIPYAFGISKDNPEDFLVQLPLEKLPSFVINSLGEKYFCIAGEYSEKTLYNSTVQLEIIGKENGTYALLVTSSDTFGSIEEYICELKEAGEDTVYFGSGDSAGAGCFIADMPISEVISDESRTILQFNHLRIRECEAFNADSYFLLEYILSCFYDTDLPCSYSFADAVFYDAEGKLELDTNLYEENLQFHSIPRITKIEKLAEEIRTKESYDTMTEASDLYIDLNLVPGENYVEDISLIVERLIKKYNLLDQHDIIFIFTSNDHVNCRMVIKDDYDPDSFWAKEYPKYGKYAYLIADSDDGSLDPYRKELTEWFDSLPE